MPHIERVKLTCYLEGVRVHIRGFRMSVSPNSPAMASIDLVPVPEAKQIPPRTLVHVFFHDDLEEKTDARDTYKLFFEGEVRGINVSQSGSQAFVTLECQDLTGYWQIVPAYLFNDMARDLFTPENNMFSIQQVTDILQSDIKGLNPSTTYRTIEGRISKILTDGVGDPQNGISLAFQEIFRSALDTSKFFRDANDRVRLVDKLDLEPFEIPSKFTLLNGQLSLVLGEERGKIMALVDYEGNLLYPRSRLEEQRAAVREFMKFFVGRERSYVGVDELMAKIQELFYYQTWPMPAAAILKDSAAELEPDRVVSCLIKPTSFFAPPPKCNVIFPGARTSVEYRRDYLSEPTRLILRSFPNQQAYGNLKFNGIRMVQNTYVAPTGLGGAIKAKLSLVQAIGKLGRVVSSFPGAAIDPLGALSSRLEDLAGRESFYAALGRAIMTDTGLPEASREDQKGVIAREISLTYHIQNLLDENHAGDHERYYANVAEFELLLSQLGARTVSVTMAWNPWIVPGLPMAVMSKAGPIFAEAARVTWSVDAQGMASTSVTGTYAHTEELFLPHATEQVGFTRVDDYMKPLPVEDVGHTRQVPLWINSAFRSPMIGMDSYTFETPQVRDGTFAGQLDLDNPIRRAGLVGAYPAIFGRSDEQPADAQGGTSFLDTYDGKLPSHDDYRYHKVKAAQFLMKDYGKEEDKTDFARRFVRRRVASLRETFEYIGAKVEDLDLIGNGTGTPFRKEYRQEVIKVAQKIGAAVAEIDDKIADQGPVPGRGSETLIDGREGW